MENETMDRLTRVKRLIEDRAGGNQSVFARMIGKSPAQVNHWLSRIKPIGEKVARDLEIAFKLPRGWLDGESDAEPSNVAPAAPKQSVPMLTWVRAGTWGEIDDHDPQTSARVPVWQSKPSRYAFALTVDGDSMESAHGQSFPSGCTIIVDPERSPKAGDYVIAKDTETQEATFKRLAYDAGRWYLKPLNRDYSTLQIDDPAKRVIGVVVEWYMGGRL
jgi:SOS-response transcriptional repressor LexA